MIPMNKVLDTSFYVYISSHELVKVFFSGIEKKKEGNSSILILRRALNYVLYNLYIIKLILYRYI